MQKPNYFGEAIGAHYVADPGRFTSRIRLKIIAARLIIERCVRWVMGLMKTFANRFDHLHILMAKWRMKTYD